MTTPTDAMMALRHLTEKNIPPVTEPPSLPSPKGMRGCGETGHINHGDRISGCSAGSAGRTTASTTPPPRLRYLGSCSGLMRSQGDSGDEAEDMSGRFATSSLRNTFDRVPSFGPEDSVEALQDDEDHNRVDTDDIHLDDRENLDDNEAKSQLAIGEDDACEQAQEDPMMNRVDCCEDLTPYLDQLDLSNINLEESDDEQHKPDLEEELLHRESYRNIYRESYQDNFGGTDRTSFRRHYRRNQLADATAAPAAPPLVQGGGDEPAEDPNRQPPRPRRPPGPPPARPVPSHRRNLPAILASIGEPTRMPGPHERMQ
mmetsp:Transcript_33169/g.83910  ORF Transcript_33169/g.83910 Transcript_33169/m.83910 type:complete len:315 (-) Transcript_33169:216-1160(-)